METVAVTEVAFYALAIVALSAVAGWGFSKLAPRLVNRHMPAGECDTDEEKAERERQIYEMRLRVQQAQAQQAGHQSEAEAARLRAEEARLRAEETNERIQKLRLEVFQNAVGRGSPEDDPHHPEERGQ